jgi:hypothetical protein
MISVARQAQRLGANRLQAGFSSCNHIAPEHVVRDNENNKSILRYAAAQDSAVPPKIVQWLLKALAFSLTKGSLFK